ncbi:MAG: sigma-70 family RNA polymerase sigma factor [Streptosporangiales bacterium]|nr:sigma-70 family RNA polymerase sigma factor [Streptosporangiales bacterium]
MNSAALRNCGRANEMKSPWSYGSTDETIARGTHGWATPRMGFRGDATMVVSPEESAVLVDRAAAGDRQAWDRLVVGYENLVWAIVRRHRLSDSDAWDVCQTVWLRLVEHIDRLSDPQRVGAWLMTTAKRECLRVQEQSRRSLLAGEQGGQGWPGDDGGVDAELLRDETTKEVREAFRELPERHQRMLSLLMTEPQLSYKEIASRLGMPVGSIGPTRGRCLEKLRNLLGEAGTYPT